MADDFCDLCFTSGVEVYRTTPCGRTIGIDCGCDEANLDGVCGNEEECEECYGVEEEE